MIASPSAASLLITMQAKDKVLATGTEFVVPHNGESYMVTNYHNLSGRRAETNDSGRYAIEPDSVTIMHNVKGKLGSWDRLTEPLYDASGTALWYEYPVRGRAVDAVVLRLT